MVKKIITCWLERGKDGLASSLDGAFTVAAAAAAAADILHLLLLLPL